MKSIIKIVSIIWILIGTSCKEPYFPELGDSQKLLVVEGQIYDDANEIIVTIGNTVPFSEQSFIAEQGATVTVVDDLERKYVLKENNAGNYSYKNFKPEYGRKYTLSIKTKKNKFYISSPQTLLPATELEPVSVYLAFKSIEEKNEEGSSYKTYHGAAFSTRLNTKNIESPFFRFSNEILVEYLERIKYESPDSITSYFYCWKKYFPDQIFNLSESDQFLNDIEHQLAFCPIDTSYLGIVNEQIWTSDPPPARVDHTIYRDLYHFAITVKMYHLNEDIYIYYKDINKQLEASNKIFDPVSFQIKGNMVCIDNPEEPVLGVFEVASVRMRTYSFSILHQDQTINYEEIDNFDINDITGSGKSYNNYPPFWIFN